MQENPISNSLSKTDSNEASNPIRSLMPFRYGPLCYAIVDVEIGLTDHRIHDIGALRYDGAIFHKASKEELLPFLERVEYLCGHNIIHHDANTSLRIDKFLGGWSTRSTSRPCSFLNVPITGS